MSDEVDVDFDEFVDAHDTAEEWQVLQVVAQLASYFQSLQI